MGKKRITTGEEAVVTTPEQAVSSVTKKTKKQVLNGIANIKVSYNNTLVSISDQNTGNIISWSSAGAMGFKGTKKSTPYAANLVAKECVEKSKKYNLTNIKIIVKGIGPGRESAIRGLASTGLNITSIMDKTPIAHNGVKARKPRRI